MLIFLIIHLVLDLVDVLLFDTNLPFVELVFLFVDEMLKLPCLSYSITGVFEPHLITLEFLLHLRRGHPHLSIDFLLVGDVSVLTHNKVYNRLILGLV